MIKDPSSTPMDPQPNPVRSNRELKRAARAALQGNWPPAIICIIVYLTVTYLVIGSEVLGTALRVNPSFMTALGIGTPVVELLLFFPLSVGCVNTFRALYAEQDTRLTRNMFRMGFCKGYLHKVWTLFLMGLLIVLGTFCFIIPGIILAYAYSMTAYLLEDRPDLSARETLRASRLLMRGHKFDLFWLQLSFIGWLLLSFLTLGIGLLWLVPYMETAQAAFYGDLTQDRA